MTMRSKEGKHLGGILVRMGLITEVQLISALHEQKTTQDFLGQILIKRGYITQEHLAEAVAKRFDMPFVELRSQYIDWEVSKRFDSSVILEQQCLPLREEDEILIVAIVNPLDARLRSEIEKWSGVARISWVVVTAGDMDKALQGYREHVMAGIRKKIQPKKEEL